MHMRIQLRGDVNRYFRAMFANPRPVQFVSVLLVFLHTAHSTLKQQKNWWRGCPPKTHVFQGFYDLFRLLPPNLPPNYHAIDRIVGSLWTKYQPCPDTVIVRFLPKRPVVRGKPPLDSVPRTRYQGYCIPDHGSRTTAQGPGRWFH